MAVMQIAIEGLSPLLMKSAASMIPTEEQVTKAKRKPKGPSPKEQEPSIEERLEASCYRLPNGDLGFPGTAIQRLIFDAAKGLRFDEDPAPGKKPKQRKTGAQTDLKGLYLVEPLELIGLLRKGKPIRTYERDVRPIVVKTKGRLVEYRPMIVLPWRMEFHVLLQMQYSPILNLAEQIVALLDHGGIVIGLGSFRPQCQGWFGKFRVAEWSMVEE